MSTFGFELFTFSLAMLRTPCFWLQRGVFAEFVILFPYSYVPVSESAAKVNASLNKYHLYAVSSFKEIENDLFRDFLRELIGM